jgi:hypothetical protein
MTEICYAGQIDLARIKQLIVDCHFAQNALLLAEQIPSRVIRNAKERHDLLRFTSFNKDRLDEETPALSDYTSGRIFQEDAELRWERQGNKMHVVYIGPQERSSVLEDYDLQEMQNLQKLKKSLEPTYCYLFGEKLRPSDLEKIGPGAQAGDFAELRIPRLLRYPVPQDGKRYVRLAVCEYINEETGQVELFRFQGLETVERFNEPI